MDIAGKHNVRIVQEKIKVSHDELPVKISIVGEQRV